VEALKLGTILQRALQSRRYEFDVERAIYLTVVHRLFASGSDRAAERWRQAYRLPGTETLELHISIAPWRSWRTAQRQPALEFWARRAALKLDREELFEQRRDLFSEID